jgi:hypothetical protein
MMNLLRLSLLAAAVLLLVPGGAAAAPAPGGPAAPTPSVPLELQPWIEWVKGVELPPGECREVDEATICVWPTRLAVSVGKAGGSFELEVTAHDAESMLLPGDDSVWPQDIRIDGKPAVVVDMDGVPSVQLAVGRHRITGVFLWSEIPDSLAVPPEVALVDLKRDGKVVGFPVRQEGLLRLLGDDEVAEEAEPEEDAAADTEAVEDALRVEVSRWIRDGVPLSVVTRVDLRVSGKARELKLPYPLWDDAELLRVDSDLPLQFGEDRSLVLAARSGSHTITLEAALPRQLETLGPPELADPWPADEVWVWKAGAAGEAALGQVALSGGQAVDRSRTHAPADWEGGATFRVSAGTPLAFEVLQRGASETAPNELRLDRVMWFDMDGSGWSVVDAIRGRMHHGARLDLRAGTLGSVIVNGKPQVVTGGVDGTSGVEVRAVDLDLRATWRAPPRDRAAGRRLVRAVRSGRAPRRAAARLGRAAGERAGLDALDVARVVASARPAAAARRVRADRPSDLAVARVRGAARARPRVHPQRRRLRRARAADRGRHGARGPAPPRPAGRGRRGRCSGCGSRGPGCWPRG